MKLRTYTFTFIGCAGTRQYATIEAANASLAYDAACMDTRLKGCKILKSSFRITDKDADIKG